MSDNQKIDPNNQLPILTKEELITLKRIDREVFNELKETIVWKSFDGKKIAIKGEYITISSFNYVIGAVPNVKTSVKLTAALSTLYLPNKIQELVDVYDIITDRAVDNIRNLIAVNQQNLTALISLFCVYPSFMNTYEAYLDDPDEHVSFTNDVDKYTPVLVTAAGELYQEDIKASAHLLIVTMAKTFAENANTRATQVDQYVQNRLNSFNNAVHVMKSNPIIITNSLAEIQPLWNLVPKLREKIFEWMRSNCQIPEFGTALTLLSSTSLTNVVAMINFIKREVTTTAHLNKTIWEETANFMGTLDKIKKEMGTDWVYFRILRPGDNRLAINRFPNLATAGNQYMLSYFDSGTYKNVICRATPTVPKIRELVEKIAPADLFVEKNVDDSGNNFMTGAKILGIDIAKVTPEGALKDSIKNDNLLGLDHGDDDGFDLSQEEFLQKLKYLFGGPSRREGSAQKRQRRQDEY